MAMLLLHQLDARHVGAIAFTMLRLQDARVAARPLRVPRTDFLEQLVGGFPLVNVAARETTRVQRARLGLGDQLFDERTQLLGLRLGRFARAVLDERGRQIPQQREPLLARATELPPRVTMPCNCPTPPCRQARPRRPDSA